jgi:hypothetical protein
MAGKRLKVWKVQPKAGTAAVLRARLSEPLQKYSLPEVITHYLNEKVRRHAFSSHCHQLFF